MKQKRDKVYLTFPTDPETAYALKKFAHEMDKTQPELINMICKDFVESILEFAKNNDMNNQNANNH